MDDSNDDLGEVAYVGKLKTQTFKQLQLEHLLKSGAVIPASKLAEAKELELQRVRDFEAAATDEERHRRTDAAGTIAAPTNLVTTREPFEDWMGTKAGTLEIEDNKKPSNSMNLLGLFEKYWRSGRAPN